MKIILLIALALTLAAPARANQEDRDPNLPIIDAIGRVVLATDREATFHPSGVVVQLRGQRLYLDLGDPVEQHDENRVNISAIPLLGQLTQPTLYSLFKGAPRVGGVYRFEDNLLVAAEDGVDPRQLTVGVERTVIANRDRSFWIDAAAGDARVPLLGDTPALGSLFRYGDVHRSEDSLIIMVNPTIVSLSE